MSEEMVHIVNDNDEVIDTVPRSVMRKENLQRRVVRILLFNSKGELFIHQRTQNKDYFPGLYDTSIAGVVTTVDCDKEAQREMNEEVGLLNPKLEFLFKFHNTEEKYFCKVYKCVSDEPLTLQEEEIVFGKFIHRSRNSRG